MKVTTHSGEGELRPTGRGLKMRSHKDGNLSTKDSSILQCTGPWHVFQSRRSNAVPS